MTGAGYFDWVATGVATNSAIADDDGQQIRRDSDDVGFPGILRLARIIGFGGTESAADVEAGTESGLASSGWYGAAPVAETCSPVARSAGLKTAATENQNELGEGRSFLQ